jgi:hypothetical protein
MGIAGESGTPGLKSGASDIGIPRGMPVPHNSSMNPNSNGPATVASPPSPFALRRLDHGHERPALRACLNRRCGWLARRTARICGGFAADSPLSSHLKWQDKKRAVRCQTARHDAN